MNIKTSLLLALTLLNGFFASVIAAPAESAFTYQGKLSDGANPASGSYDFRFVLYNAGAGGSQVGDILTSDNLTVLGGVFTASLDFGAEFDGSPRWIEIAVRPGASLGDFTVLSPRQPLTPAPYALYALTPAGPQGVPGAKGDKGDVGAPGPVGETGPQGLIGPTGSPGPAGSKGDTGAIGPQGLKGDTGLTGPQGLAGPKGDPGAAGGAGATGATGPQGIQGVAGAAGPVGPQGPVGLIGPIGPSGAVGATGNPGATGPAGPAGAIGTTGPAGAKGVNWRGAWSAATGYVLSDAVALNGSSWQAKVANTASAPFEGSVNWDLLARKGDPGTTGAQGPAGTAGATGAQGPQGPTGPAGAPGATGTTGPQGIAGPQGPSGAFSLTGNTASFLGGNVGIGTSSPQAKLHVEGGDLLAGAPGKEWIFHTRSHAGSDFLHITDSDNGGYHFEHGLTLDKAGNVGIGPTSGLFKLEVAGGTRMNGEMIVRNSIQEMILYVSPAIVYMYKGLSVSGTSLLGELQVSGHAYKTGGGTGWETLSDRRLKQEVRAYEPGLNEVLQLRPVRFHYRDDPERGLTSVQEEVGFIAQEVREVIPEAVTEGKDGYLSLKADPIHWAAINAIQTLNAKLESESAALRSELQSKDTRIAALERSVAELKALVSGFASVKGGAR